MLLHVACNGIKAVNGVAVRRQTVRVREKCETYGTSDSMVAWFIVRQSVRQERVDFKGWGWSCHSQSGLWWVSAAQYVVAVGLLLKRVAGGMQMILGMLSQVWSKSD